MYPTDLITNISPCPTTKEEHRNNGEYKGHKLTHTYSELQNTDHRKIIQLCTLHPFRLSQDNNICYWYYIVFSHLIIPCRLQLLLF